MSKARAILFATLSVLVFAAPVLAQTGAAAGADGGGSLLAKTGSLAVAIAAFGGALGDGRAIAAACEGTARNPAAGGRIFTMMLLGLALIETLVLFTFAAAFQGY
jgi:F-type H+-transporting ATPase subunit c